MKYTRPEESYLFSTAVWPARLFFYATMRRIQNAKSVFPLATTALTNHFTGAAGRARIESASGEKWDKSNYTNCWTYPHCQRFTNSLAIRLPLGALGAGC